MATAKTKNVDTNLSDESKSFQDRIDEVRTLVEENLRYTKSLSQKSGANQDLKGQQDLQKLLQENLKISKDLYEMTKKIKHWVAWQRVWGVVKILIIAIPLILGIIYGPTLLREALKPYQELLSIGTGATDQNLLKQVQSLINTEKNENSSR